MLTSLNYPISLHSDLDNLVKFVLDALNKHAFLDNSQVVMVTCMKLFTEGEARTSVKLQRLSTV
jgi:Holliday junction resolvase RusA-like endonuclease